jgi:YHS domain-containing protein
MHANRLTCVAGSLLLALALSFPATAADTAKVAANQVANDIAVCGCGKIFAPDATTEYISYNGKQYACCTHACHEMAMKDAAASAKLSEDQTSQFLGQITHLKLGVGNVIAITEKGTKALCGCGKQFAIDETTEYLSYDGKSYACCTHGCHEMAAKDIPGAVKAVEKQMATLE